MKDLYRLNNSGGNGGGNGGDEGSDGDPAPC